MCNQDNTVVHQQNAYMVSTGSAYHVNKENNSLFNQTEKQQVLVWIRLLDLSEHIPPYGPTKTGFHNLQFPPKMKEPPPL